MNCFIEITVIAKQKHQLETLFYKNKKITLFDEGIAVNAVWLIKVAFDLKIKFNT